MTGPKEEMISHPLEGGDSEIGYRRPPKDTRFKPGQSGNPKGRPKGSISSAAFLRKILKEKATLREGPRTRTMSKLELMHYAQVHKAMKGDSKAYKTLMEMANDDPTVLEPLPILQFLFTDDIDNQQEAQRYPGKRKK
jgi:hypothetical protein